MCATKASLGARTTRFLIETNSSLCTSCHISRFLLIYFPFAFFTCSKRWSSSWGFDAGKKDLERHKLAMTTSESVISRSLRPFLFGLLLISSLAVKVLHLKRHGSSLSLLDWIILLPFFFFQDAALAVIGRLLFAHSCRRRKIFDPPALGFFLTQVDFLHSPCLVD